MKKERVKSSNNNSYLHLPYFLWKRLCSGGKHSSEKPNLYLYIFVSVSLHCKIIETQW